MPYSEVAINNRIEVIIEVEIQNTNGESDRELRSHRGLVMEIDEAYMILVSELGEVLEIERNDIICINRISFDKQISAVITKIKTYYQEKMELKEKLRELDELEPELMEELYDANLLAKFNIYGARNRLNKSISREFFNFNRGSYKYIVKLDCNPNSEIELYFKVYNNTTHYSSDNIDLDKMIRVHAPDDKGVIEKAFNSLYKVEELKKYVEHEIDDIYNVISTYKVNIEITEAIFVDKRDEICESLNNLRK